jgi:PKD repeat protein
MVTRNPGRIAYIAVLVAAIVLSITGCQSPMAITPIACIQAEPTIGYAPLTIAFDASCSFVPEGAEGIYDFQWEFEDGSEGAGRTAVHTFTDPGTYTVAVIMLKTQGGSIKVVDIGRRVVTVLPPAL